MLKIVGKIKTHQNYINLKKYIMKIKINQIENPKDFKRTSFEKVQKITSLQENLKARRQVAMEQTKASIDPISLAEKLSGLNNKLSKLELKKEYYKLLASSETL